MFKKFLVLLLLISSFLLICTSIKYKMGTLASASIQTPIAVAAALLMTKNMKAIRLHLLFFLWFALVVILNYSWGDKYYYSLELSLFSLLSILLSLLVGSLVVNSSHNHFIWYFSLSQLMGIIIVCITTIIVDISMPGIVRKMVGFSTLGDTESIQFYNTLGVCTYGFPHSLPILVPPLVYLYRKATPLIKMFSASVLLLIGYLIYISGITTPFLLFLLALIWSILFTNSSFKIKSPGTIIFLILSLLFLFDDIQIGALDILDQIVPKENQNVHVRIHEMVDGINGKTTDDLGTRQEHYEQSFQAFYENILLGTNNAIGGHSSLLDQFASMGLIGGIPFVLLIFCALNYVIKNSPKDMKLSLLISSFCFFFMLAFKNANEINLWFFMFCLTPAIMRMKKLLLR